MGGLVKTKGKIKQAVGSLTGDKALKRAGEKDEREGHVEKAVGPSPSNCMSS